MGREPPKKRRPEQNAGHHFSHHGWLPKASKEPADGIRDRNDNKELKEKTAERICRVLLQPLPHRLAKRGGRSRDFTLGGLACVDERKGGSRSGQMTAGTEN